MNLKQVSKISKQILKPWQNQGQVIISPCGKDWSKERNHFLQHILSE